MNNPDNSRHADEVVRAEELARQYGCEFADLHNFRLNPEILKRVPAELMLRFNFLPLEETPDGRLAISLADPSELLLIDEISLLLGRRLIVRVATLSRINEILRGIDPSQQHMTSDPTDDPPSPSPDAPVDAPKKPKPRARSGAAKATPELDQ